ncbi:MAG: class I SAM-dependent methyltransferase [Verrucomicrobiota bacterium]
MSSSRVCRFCNAGLTHTFVDLGVSPIANDFLAPAAAERMEPFYPLHAFVCDQCWLVQLGESQSAGHIFSENYAYFSSFSKSWLEHARNYATMAISRFGLGASNRVVEIASNDGYLLQYFQAAGIPVLGVDPSANVAAAAEKRGISTWVRFFGTETAHDLVKKVGQADLLIGNNVLAHVPVLNDFVAGLKIALKPKGAITMEFPHLLRLIEQNQFDTIYHEHYSYFSLLAVEKVFAAHGLTIFDVEELPTHGGSLRIYAGHAGAVTRQRSVEQLVATEIKAGLNSLAVYESFAQRVQRTKRRLLEFLISAKASGKSIVGYGAPAKGNTLLNYCGIRTDFVDYTVDLSPHKQGLLLPGTHIPVYSPEQIAKTKPDYVLILPWNLRDEITKQLAYVREWGGQFIVPIPEVAVVPAAK